MCIHDLIYFIYQYSEKTKLGNNDETKNASLRWAYKFAIANLVAFVRACGNTNYK
jgi:hypothetical protein